MTLDAEAVIVGGGPVGLFLALSLLAEGISVRVVEREASPRPGTRSIGVHPPSLEILDELGLAQDLIARGVRVRRGRAFGEHALLGIVDFGTCPPPHRYVLAAPQEQTERVLRSALLERAPEALLVGEVISAEQDGVGVVVQVRDGGAGRTLRGLGLFACDGKRSALRDGLDIPFDGAPYPGFYAMADFPDESGLGKDAAIYLDRDGLVESFPLPCGVRRWVARIDGAKPLPVSEPGARTDGLASLVARVAGRCGAWVDGSRAIRPSVFQAERRLARTLARGRVALVGDAAHVVSPIGGQGMNLGWMGARMLAADFASAVRAGHVIEDVFLRNGAQRGRMARAAARRAELNMWLGRPGKVPWARDALLSGLLRRPLVDAFSRLFTMRGLALGV